MATIKKRDLRSKKIQAMVTAPTYDLLVEIKDALEVSLSDLVSQVLMDYVRKEKKKYGTQKKKQDQDKTPPPPNPLRADEPLILLEGDEEKWWEKRSLTLDDPLPPLSQIKDALERNGYGYLDPEEARMRLDKKREEQIRLTSWESVLIRWVAKDMKKEMA